MQTLRVKTLFLAVLTCFAAALLFAAKVNKEGKEWLELRTEPAAMNVSGAWQSKEWGPVTLNQPDGSRDVTGRGDGWDITGVVSGKKLYLLFGDKGNITYSAELSQDSPNALSGNYVRGLLSEGKPHGLRPMHLSK